MRGFAEDPKYEFSGNRRFRAREASHPCNHVSRGRDSSYSNFSSHFGLNFGLKMVEGFKGLFGQKNAQNPTFFGDGGLCLGELEVNFHVVLCFTKAN